MNRDRARCVWSVTGSAVVTMLTSGLAGMGAWVAGVVLLMVLLGALVFAVAAWVLLFTGDTERRRGGARTLLAHLPFLRHR